MKLQSYAMIRCILPNDQDKVDSLSAAITQKLKKYWPNIQINLNIDAPYWKYEKSREVIFNIMNDRPIFVKDITEIIDLSWIYSKEPVFDIHTQKTIDEEEAIWSKQLNTMESFLNTEAEWVCLYTWLD